MAAGFCSVGAAGAATVGGKVTGAATGEAGVNIRVCTSVVVEGAVEGGVIVGVTTGASARANLTTGAIGGKKDSALDAVEFTDSELASLKRMPRGFELLKAKPKTTLAPRTPTNCQAIRRVRELPNATSADGD